MKKIATFLLLCCALFAFQAKAQYPSVTVQNTTACDLYYTLYGSDKGSCSLSSRSGVLFIAAGATVTFANPTVVPLPGLLAVDNIIGGGVYNKNPSSCTFIPTQLSSVYNPCVNTTQANQVDTYDNVCKVCSFVKIEWVMSGSAQTLRLF